VNNVALCCLASDFKPTHRSNTNVSYPRGAGWQLNAFDLVTLSSALNLNNLFVYKQPTDAADAVRALPTPTLAPPTPMRYTSRAEPGAPPAPGPTSTSPRPNQRSHRY